MPDVEPLPVGLAPGAGPFGGGANWSAVWDPPDSRRVRTSPDDRFRPSPDALPMAITSRIDEVEVLDFGPPNEDTRAGRHDVALGVEFELSRLGIDGVRLGEEQILFVRISGGV